jgi:2-phosphosulfolactate phosphatase
MSTDFSDQTAFMARLDWGEAGLRALVPHAAVVVIIDVMSFTTAVSVAVDQGATVYPYRWADATAQERARELNAVLAVHRRNVSLESPYSLSPATLQSLPSGTKLVLPSPNGSTLTVIAAGHDCTVIAGCLRNASAIGRFCSDVDGPVAVIAAGERWEDDAGGSLRPAFEDLMGAGAILAAINGKRHSPEALAAIGAFSACRASLATFLTECASGRELIEGGYPEDVTIAAAHDVSNHFPVLIDGAYRSNARSPSLL